MSADSYLGQLGDPLSLNLYTYCQNEPLMYYDPTGHAVTDYDLEHCTPEQIAEIIAATDAWNEAYAAGDTAGMAAPRTPERKLPETKQGIKAMIGVLQLMLMGA
jgi:hypothetical protein